MFEILILFVHWEELLRIKDEHKACQMIARPPPRAPHPGYSDEKEPPPTSVASSRSNSPDSLDPPHRPSWSSARSSQAEAILRLLNHIASPGGGAAAIAAPGAPAPALPSATTEPRWRHHRR